jgi:hypothetical protein
MFSIPAHKNVTKPAGQIVNPIPVEMVIKSNQPQVLFSFVNADQGTKTQMIRDRIGSFRVVLIDTDADKVVSSLWFTDYVQAYEATGIIHCGATLPGDSVRVF